MKLRTRIRLRYRLWRLDQAKKMTAERAGYIVAAGCIVSFAAITALLHPPVAARGRQAEPVAG